MDDVEKLIAGICGAVTVISQVVGEMKHERKELEENYKAACQAIQDVVPATNALLEKMGHFFYYGEQAERGDQENHKSLVDMVPQMQSTLDQTSTRFTNALENLSKAAKALEKTGAKPSLNFEQIVKVSLSILPIIKTIAPEIIPQEWIRDNRKLYCLVL